METKGSPNFNVIPPDQETDPYFPCSACGVVLDAGGFLPLDPVACPECGATTMVPAKIQNYHLRSLLGEGAMGRVYLATDLNLHRDVAIKILRQNFASTPRMWTLLEKEARAAAGIRHNNVVQIYSMGKTLGRPYIIMELVEDKNLEVRMHEAPLSEREALEIGAEVMEGLRAAYTQHLIHGDIKPANILLTAKGRAKVADFGLSRLVGHETSVERWGTPYYIAPEKSTRTQEDFRSDQYSLGATLFHCLTQHAPFEGEGGEEVIAKSLSQPTPWVLDLRPDLSESCADILYRMMQRDPDKRFQAYDEAIQAMRKAKAGKYRPGNWEGARRLQSNNLLNRLRRAWEGQDGDDV